jgi:ketosteroid isomerase-like protein
MKVLRLILCGAGLATILSNLAAQSRPAEEIRQAENQWIAAIKAHDQAVLDKILSKDLVYTHSSGVVENKSQYIAAVTSEHQKYSSVEYETPAIQIYGATGVLTTSARMTGLTKGVPFDNRLRLLHVWTKQEGSWVLVAHQTTKLP